MSKGLIAVECKNIFCLYNKVNVCIIFLNINLSRFGSCETFRPYNIDLRMLETYKEKIRNDIYDMDTSGCVTGT